MAARHLIRHDLNPTLARRVTRKALETYRERFSEYQPGGEWITDDLARVRFTVLGRTLEGVVEVLPRDVALELDVPLVFRPFRGVALKVIEDEIQGWITKAKNGEFDAPDPKPGTGSTGR